MNLHKLTIAAAQKKLRAKEFSATELTKACLRRLEAVEGKLNAFITVCADEALKQAGTADELLAKNAALPLTGIPFSIKDVFVTKGIQTTAGAHVLKGYCPQYSATVYTRLMQQHAVLIGKTNCDAWGHGSSNENSDFGPTRNPWNTAFVPGGSSGGSAASIAADACLFSVAEDTGGSIRLPASFCGVSGLKPTYGRVSRYGSIAFASSLDTVGPMAKTAQDIAIVLEAVSGRDMYDATTLPTDVPPYADELHKPRKGLTMGLVKEFFDAGMTDQVRRRVEEAIKELKGLGVSFVEVSLPSVPYAVACYYLLAPAEASSNLARFDGIRYGASRDAFGDEAKRRIMIGTYSLSAGYYDAYYKKGQKTRTLVKDEFDAAFQRVDLLLAPTAPNPPFRIGEKTDDPLAMYLVDAFTIPVNLAGLASLAVPCGFTTDTLPVGMQIIGPQLSESRILYVAHAYQQTTQWHEQKPPL